jgi:putative DNA methylase
MQNKAFIEEQFPVSLISKESYKERMSGATQTLTCLGNWKGRKPLILVRAVILGLLMPASDNAHKDREIFLKILTMDTDGLWQRRQKSIPAKEIYTSLSENERDRAFTVSANKISWQRGLKSLEKEEITRNYFNQLNYDDKLNYCLRPEQIDGASPEAWKEINQHLETIASSLKELVHQLGIKRFGKVPKVGDVFAGGGSIPFETARLGCETYGSDLNPVAAMLTWGATHILGGGEEIRSKVEKAQQEVFAEVDKQITEWGIEHNSQGWRAEVFLYCIEAKSPATEYWIPLAPSWVISEKYGVVAVLRPDHKNKRYHIDIKEGVDSATLKEAKEGTIKNGRLVCPETGEDFAISEIRGDRTLKVESESRGVSRNARTRDYGLRLWENEDLVPLPDDTFQERLFCVRWSETYIDDKGKEKSRRHFSSVTEADLERERKAFSLLTERFKEWQEKGFIPSKKIEPGNETTRLFRERGWTHWHHLFTPRQLLMHGLFLEKFNQLYGNDPVYCTAACLSVGSAINRLARLCGVDPHVSKGPGSTRDVFFNQALNPQYIYGSRAFQELENFYKRSLSSSSDIECTDATIECRDARENSQVCDLWITDPPYADAVHYHELSEFFLSWYEGNFAKAFPNWHKSVRVALAVRGNGEDFKRSMVEIYSNLTEHMSDEGMQLVMFTHQDPSVWADLGMILWAAGLQVSAAWTISTETDSSLKKGNYVQGTVLLVLRKRLNNDVAFLDEIYPLIEDEVREQLDKMLAIDDKDDPNFGDTDYQLAAYAAALRVLTQYGEIEGMDIKHELFRERQKSEKSEFEKVIDRAVEIACNHLVPEDFAEFHWKSLTADERLYLKGVELEKHGEFRNGAYQELAKGFGVRDYNFLYAKTKSNEARFKTASEFKRTNLKGDGFDLTLVRHLLFAIHETVSKETVQEGLNYLKVEVPNYWSDRKRSLEILRYLSRLEHIPHLLHWKKDAEAARVLAGAVENDHG